MGRLAGSGVRAKSLMTRRAGLAQMTADDFSVRRCKYCDRRIDLVKHPDSAFCSRSCGSGFRAQSKGLVKGPRVQRVAPAISPYRGRWASVFEQAEAANGDWVVIRCDSASLAAQLQQSVCAKRGFRASRNNQTVTLRYEGQS